MAREPDLEEWTSRTELADALHEPVGLIFQVKSTFFFPFCLPEILFYLFNQQVRIAMVGKYTGLSDSYLSVLKVE